MPKGAPVSPVTIFRKSDIGAESSKRERTGTLLNRGSTSKQPCGGLWRAWLLTIVVTDMGKS